MKAILGSDGWANIIQYNYELFVGWSIDQWASHGRTGRDTEEACINILGQDVCFWGTGWAQKYSWTGNDGPLCPVQVDGPRYGPNHSKVLINDGWANVPETSRWAGSCTWYWRMGPDVNMTIPKGPHQLCIRDWLTGTSSVNYGYRIYTTTEIRYHLDMTQINLSDMVDKMRSNRSTEWEWLEHLHPEQLVQITDPNFHTNAGGWAEGENGPGKFAKIVTDGPSPHACSGKWAMDGPKMCEDRPSGLHVILKIMTDGPTVDLISEKANWPSAYADVVSETVMDGPSPLCLDLEKATDGPSPPWV
ncbi:hypothetical protein BDR06DRAFT_969925 [Suillus hirtellus]|nr:hypothetical protein BDR06DRAFT_969925 [Suillus hirtellus]